MPSDTTRAVLGRRRKVKRSGHGWVACCPAHDDREASLSVGEGKDGRVLLNCHAGCAPAAIVSALSLAMGDLFPEDAPRTGADVVSHPRAYRPGGAAAQSAPAPAPHPAGDSAHDDRATWPEVVAYDYVDVDGALVFQAVRYEPRLQPALGKRKKHFRQRRPDGRGGFVYSLDGVSERPLYHRPDLAEIGRPTPRSHPPRRGRRTVVADRRGVTWPAETTQGCVA